jgi:hypothetical protein
VWFLLGWGGFVVPQRAVFVLGAIGMLIGAGLTLPTYAGIALGLSTVVVLAVTAVLFRDLVLLAVSAFGAFQILPSAVVELFPGDLAPPIALLVVGGLLVGAAIYTAYQSREQPATEGPARDYAAGPARTALTAAATVAAAVTTAVLILTR